MVDIKIYSWNVNGLRAVLRKGALQAFLKEHSPDILCLQEIKCTPDQLDLFETDTLKDYEIFWNPAKRPGYSGTAIMLRKDELNGLLAVTKENMTDLLPARKELFDEFTLNEGRILALDCSKFYLVNVYTPNSKPDLSRLKLRHDEWDPEFKDLLRELEKEKPVITCGDFNCAHKDIDLARPKTNHHNAGFTDEEREGLARLIDAGFIDTFRNLHPKTQRYTWWSHWGRARENNVGWRIDYFFISKSLKDRLKDAEIYESVTGSDHCPISITVGVD